MLIAKALVGSTHFYVVMSVKMIFNIEKSGETIQKCDILKLVQKRVGTTHNRNKRDMLL